MTGKVEQQPIDTTWDIGDLAPEIIEPAPPVAEQPPPVAVAEAPAYPKLTIQRANELIFRMFRHDTWEAYRVIGTVMDGTARAKRRDDERLFIIRNERIEDWI